MPEEVYILLLRDGDHDLVAFAGVFATLGAAQRYVLKQRPHATFIEKSPSRWRVLLDASMRDIEDFDFAEIAKREVRV